MKDNTAAVHAQVPVEVASFLLNEKRTEIAKIEVKQRINVLLVPNKALETPNYKLERLKHDDPRLDNIEASYKMAEEIEDPTAVTRRSQEPTNKQTPVIKGVLPDAPAPVVEPKPAAEKAPVAAAQAPAASAPPAEKGFFSWLKGLFGGAPKAEPAAPAAVEDTSAKKEERREGRGGRDGRRGGRRGERGGDRAERSERPESRGEARPERGPRSERGNRPARDGQTDMKTERRAPETTATEATPAGETRADRAPRPERSGEPRRERGERGDRRRDRGPRSEDTQGDLPQAGVTAPEGLPSQADPTQPDQTNPPLRAETEAGQEERRERRSRDRYGRDRRERAERPANDATGAPTSASDATEGAAPAARPPRERRERFNPSERQADTRANEPTPSAATAAPVRTGMPRIGHYVLPVQTLSELAQSASMEWVQSSAERVAAVQAAIAAEPQPVHVPRERPAPVVLDDGPLILVETRKDLAQLNMPFETPAAG